MAELYAGKKCVVTGGASFIGSHLTDELVAMGSEVIVVDDFSSGRWQHLDNVRNHPNLEIVKADLRLGFPESVDGRDTDVVFHLAAIHGGRGYIDTYAANMFDNAVIDRNVMAWASRHAEMLVHASSACAYPTYLQSDEQDRLLLLEESAGFDVPQKSFPDGTYGWMKLMGELQAKTLAESAKFRARSARIFTAYGERENESHAAIALIAKAILRMDPYPIWGSGQQTRNFTYVKDTAKGLLLLGSDERTLDYDVFNIGTSTHDTVLEFVEAIFRELSWWPVEFDFQLDKPTGVGSRAASNTKMREVFEWEPLTPISDGIRSTLSWYEGLAGRPTNVVELEALLIAR